LTSPSGSGGSFYVELDRAGEVACWLSLDPSRTSVTAIEILDGKAYGF
jgi:hypothetical protein